MRWLNRFIEKLSWGELIALIVIMLLLMAAILSWYLLENLSSADTEPVSPPPIFQGKVSQLQWFEDSKKTPDFPLQWWGFGRWQPISLQSWEDKVVLVNFWASWCKPCIEELPSLNQLKTNVGDSDFVVAAVTLDTPESLEKAMQFWRNLNLNKLQLVAAGQYDGRGQSVIKAFGIDTIPLSLLLNRQGRIAAILHGDANWASPSAEKAIEWLLQQP